MSVPSDIAAARAAVLARIAQAAAASGREPESITLTAVSKLQPDDRVEAMLANPRGAVLLGSSDLKPSNRSDGLFWPGAVSADGAYLWVGEFKFSGRILRFRPR